jgi:poly [ADP-ribose] polymerase
MSNFVGILRNGLKIAPPEAPSTGYLFGKGLYFTDCCSKAASYCRASDKNPEGILVLSEVALGVSHNIYRPKQFLCPP